MGVQLKQFRRPAFVGHLFRRGIWAILYYTLFRLSPRPRWAWRRLLLRLFGATVGTGVKLHPTCAIYEPWNLVVGDHSWIGPHAELYNDCRSMITIGSNVVVSQYAYLCTGSHDIEDQRFATTSAPIIIHDQAWLAAHTFVGPGVTVGEGAVLGARSCAFRDLPPWHVCLGTPARPVRPRVLRPEI